VNVDRKGSISYRNVLDVESQRVSGHCTLDEYRSRKCIDPPEVNPSIVDRLPVERFVSSIGRLESHPLSNRYANDWRSGWTESKRCRCLWDNDD
jgi:hypothetical protein